MESYTRHIELLKGSDPFITMDNLDFNTRSYWDKRFETDWESNAGREQTLYFYNLVNNFFPKWLKDKLNDGIIFADVGCAEGDGVDYFSRAYPKSEFIGFDFSEIAINKAKDHYPNLKFVRSDIMDIEGAYDVVFSSNTLEHFVDPFLKIQYLFKLSHRYVVLLLPFQEYERFQEHFYTFDYNDFKVSFDNFKIVYSQEIDCKLTPNIFWPGKQILIIYANNKVLSEHPDITLRDYINVLSSNYDELFLKLQDTESQVKSQESELSGIHAMLEQKKDEILYKESINQKLATDIKELEKNYERIYEDYRILNNTCIEYMSKMRTLEKEINEHKKNIFNQNKQIEWLLNEKYKVDIELIKIKSTVIWKILSKVCAGFNKTRSLIKKVCQVYKRHGAMALAKKVNMKIKGKISGRNKGDELLLKLYSNIKEKVLSDGNKSIHIITSAFEFKELYNQRTINLAKYLSRDNDLVFFVVWQWNKEEIIPNQFKEVYPNIFQVPLFNFLEQLNCLDDFKGIGQKTAFLNLPSQNWNAAMFELKQQGFKVIYDIMDDWEQFFYAKQAPWYLKEAEESIIINADMVFAVSDVLTNKFSFLRKDIVTVGNGFYAELLGKGNINISLNKQSDSNCIKLGYFGHLTESWFDWEIIEKMLEQKNIQIEIIGYGASEETLENFKKFSNFNYVGTVEPNQLYKYVQNWDIGLIPFKETLLSLAVDPIKVYEYIYFGLKVIVTGMPHLKEYPYVYIYEDKANHSINDFICDVFQKQISEEVNEKRMDFLSNTNWESRFERMLKNPTNCYLEIFNYDK